MRIVPGSLREMLQRSRPLLALSRRVSQRSVVLGALLLLGSTLSVWATANTPVHIAQVTLNPSSSDEGQTVAVHVAFEDPDLNDVFTAWIHWLDGSPDTKLLIPAGQRTFQASHIFTDNGPFGSDGTLYPRQISVVIVDRQHADGNDNAEPYGYDGNLVEFMVKNVAPVINSHAVKVTKAPGKSGAVVVEGTYTEPGTLDDVKIIANWGDWAPGQPKPQSACTVTPKGKTFRCEHTYPVVPAKTYHLMLKAQDKDGGEHSVTHAIHIP
jgi:hypothetical protein